MSLFDNWDRQTEEEFNEKSSHFGPRKAIKPKTDDIQSLKEEKRRLREKIRKQNEEIARLKKGKK